MLVVELLLLGCAPLGGDDCVHVPPLEWDDGWPYACDAYWRCHDAIYYRGERYGISWNSDESENPEHDRLFCDACYHVDGAGWVLGEGIPECDWMPNGGEL